MLWCDRTMALWHYAGTDLVCRLGDTLYNGSSWVIVPGISNANFKGWWQQTIELFLICLFSIDLVFEPKWAAFFDNVKLKSHFGEIRPYFLQLWAWLKCKDDGVEINFVLLLLVLIGAAGMAQHSLAFYNDVMVNASDGRHRVEAAKVFTNPFGRTQEKWKLSAVIFRAKMDIRQSR